MGAHIEANGGEVRLNSRLQEIELDADGNVSGYILSGGERVEADLYVSAMPVDVLKNLLPQPWKQMQFFSKMDALKGPRDEPPPVVRPQAVRGEPPPLLPLAHALRLRRHEHHLRGVLQRGQEHAGAGLRAGREVAEELGRGDHRGDHEGAGAALPGGDQGRRLPGQAGEVQDRAHPAVRVQDLPNLEPCRPTQKTPIKNFFLAGDFTKQRYLASMEGAVLSGKLCANEIVKAGVAGEVEAGQNAMTS